MIIAAIAVVAYLLIAILLWRFQERIVFQPPAWRDRQPIREQVKTLEVATADGLRGRIYQIGEGNAAPIIAFHGNAEIARWQIPWAIKASGRSGRPVFLVEYRGYDGLEGSPTYEGVQRDVEIAHGEILTRTKAAATDCVLYGHSLGSAVAAELATARRCRALVLESPFTSAREMVARWPVVGFRVGWSLVSRVHYDTLSRVKELDAPVWVAHGERDVVVPTRMGKAVYAAARVQGELLLVPGAGHSDVPEVAGDEYWEWIGRAAGL